MTVNQEAAAGNVCSASQKPIMLKVIEQLLQYVATLYAGMVAVVLPQMIMFI